MKKILNTNFILTLIPYCFSIFTLVSMHACNTKPTENRQVSQQLIDKNVLVKLLTELTIIETGYQTKYEQLSTYSDNLISQADSIFNVFNTNKENFQQSMQYYVKQREIEEIYTLVEENLKIKLKQLKNENKNKN